MLNLTWISIVYAALFYFAACVLIVGVGRKIYQYAHLPAPLKIPTMPAPMTHYGVVWRILSEVLFFKSLFRADKPTWFFAILFHWALWLVLLRHSRYFMDIGAFLIFIQPLGKYASFAMVFGLAGLWARRIFVDRIRYISAPSDHLMLMLLLAIALIGIVMSFIMPTNIGQVSLFFRGLFSFRWQNLPSDVLLLLHLLLVAILMLVFPISKLLHAPGVFFSPSRNQVDNPREKPHLYTNSKE